MSDTLDDLVQSVREEAEARGRTLQRLLWGTDASRVFGAPVTSGDFTVIAAAEIASGGGLGSGIGFGGLRGRKDWNREQAPARTSAGGGREEVTHDRKGVGGGGGGGGGSVGRPIAAIVIGPEGVEIRPIVDVTKLVLTGLSVFAAVAALSVRMWTRRR